MTVDFRRNIARDDTVGAGNYFYRFADDCTGAESPILECDQDIVLGGGNYGRRLSVATLRGLAERLATWSFRQGFRPRQCVGVFIEDGPLYYLLHIALCRIGAIPVQLNSKMAGSVAAEYLRRVGCLAVIVDREREVRLDPHSAVLAGGRVMLLEQVELPGQTDGYEPFVHGPNDPTLIAHTSGTTGAPKPVRFNHRGYFFGVRQQMFQPVGRKVMSALPHSHGSAITMFMSTVIRGVPLLAQTRKDPESFLDSMEAWKPNLVMAFPKPLVDLCRADLESRDLSSVSCWMSTGDASHERHIRRLIAFGSRTQGGELRRGSTYIDNLGSSEFAFGILRNVLSPELGRYGRCIGQPFAWVDVEIFGEDGAPARAGTVGRLAVKSPTVTDGYWNDPVGTEANRLNGYWLTGDLVFRNEAGLYFHVDRTTDRTLIANRMIYSCQMEEALMTRVEEIFDCTVVGINEEGRAHVAVGVEPVDPACERDALERRIRAELAELGVICPARVEIVEPGWQDGLTGKKLKRLIRVAARAESRV
jgi:long-chain acyl-CoA synthetase